MNPASNDWRRQGQEQFLCGVRLTWQSYTPYRAGWDHDHCEFCGNKFSLAPTDLHSGYATDDRYHWVCEPCFQDFSGEFGWDRNPLATTGDSMKIVLTKEEEVALRALLDNPTLPEPLLRLRDKITAPPPKLEWRNK